MSDLDDEKLSLRDKIVLSLLSGYLNENGNKGDSNVREALLFPDENDENKFTIRRVENRIRAAYKMADLIRKIRLESFS